jgi:hypothetical protein
MDTSKSKQRTELEATERREGKMNQYPKLQTTRRLVKIAPLLVLLSMSATVKADPFSLGVASQFAVLYIGSNTGNTLNMSNPAGAVMGNVGLLNGSVNTSGPQIIGNVVFSAMPPQHVQSSGSASVSGTITANAALLAQANTDARNASTTAAGLAATNGTTSITGNGNTTLTGGAGVNVVNLTDLVLSGGSLTLIAPAGGSWVLNITGNFTLSGGADVNIGGSLTADDVLINVLGAGGDVHTSGGGNGAVIFGTILAVDRNISLAPGLVNGRLISGGNNGISIVSGAQVSGPTGPPIPEPTTATLLGLGLAGLASRFRRRRSLPG